MRPASSGALTAPFANNSYGTYAELVYSLGESSPARMIFLALSRFYRYSFVKDIIPRPLHTYAASLIITDPPVLHDECNSSS
jgi:hypothetical protein